MAQADEAATSKTPFGADMAAGIGAISYDQVITFTKYVKKMLTHER